MVLVHIDKAYNFPTMLSEITLREYILLVRNIQDEDYESAICNLIGLPRNVYSSIDESSVLLCVDLLQLLFNSETILTKHLDIHELIDCPIGQFEDWKASVEQEPIQIETLKYLVLLQRGEYDYDKRMNEDLLDFLNLPASVVIYYQNIVNEEMETLKANFLPLFENDLEDIHEEAGVGTLLNYGGYATLYNLANGIFKDIELVATKTVGEAYTFLSYKKQEEKYIENLKKLKNEEAIRNNKVHRK